MHLATEGVNTGKAYTWTGAHIFQNDVTLDQDAVGDLVKGGLGITGQIALGANLDQDDWLIKRDVDGASSYSEAGALLRFERDVTNVTSEDGRYIEADSVFRLTHAGGAIFGTGSTNHGLSDAAADVLVSGKLEVNGNAFIDGSTNLIGTTAVKNVIQLFDDKPFRFGGGNDSDLDWSTAQATENTLVWGLGGTANSLVFTTYANRNKDFDHAAQTNPTLLVHSATDPDSANDEWISLTHDVTDGVIDVGSGGIKLGGSGFGCCNTGPQAQQAHIVDADGQLADITTKFNTLLADLEGYGILAAA